MEKPEQQNGLVPFANELIDSEENAERSEELFSNNEASKLIETYLREDFPKPIKEHPAFMQFWAVLGKSLKLSFLTETDVLDLESMYDEAMYNYIMSKPAYEYDFIDEQILDQNRFHLLVNMRRAVGTSKHVINERTMLTTQIRQQIRSNTENFMGGSGGGGFFSKLRGAL